MVRARATPNPTSNRTDRAVPNVQAPAENYGERQAQRGFTKSCSSRRSPSKAVPLLLQLPAVLRPTPGPSRSDRWRSDTGSAPRKRTGACPVPSPNESTE